VTAVAVPLFCRAIELSREALSFVRMLSEIPDLPDRVPRPDHSPVRPLASWPQRASNSSTCLFRLG